MSATLERVIVIVHDHSKQPRDRLSVDSDTPRWVGHTDLIIQRQQTPIVSHIDSFSTLCETRWFRPLATFWRRALA
jgi:hypothetical protein